MISLTLNRHQIHKVAASISVMIFALLPNRESVDLLLVEEIV